jgi:hypothetical protein
MDIRHLTLAPLALVAVVGIAPSASAAPAPTPAPVIPAPERPCGQPAVDPVYGTIQHPAVTETVPAVTREEWRWTRTVDVVERAYSRVVTAASGTVRWTRAVDVLERAFATTVIDRAYQAGTPEVGHHETRVVTPAVTQTLWEYRQQTSGKTRWEVEGWNAGDNGKGWSWTGRTEVREVTPAVTTQVWVVDHAAVPEVTERSHVETTWVLDGALPPAGATATGATRVASTSTDTRDLAPGVVPDGAGWVEGAYTETTPAVVDTIWVRDGDPVAAGYDPTGATRPGTPDVETTSDTSALPPAGDGWTPIADSRVVVEVVAARVVEISPAWVEDFIQVPGLPATPACAESEGSGGDDDPGTDPGTDPVVPAEGGDDGDVVGEVEVGPAGDVAPAVATPAPADAVLPATGGPVDPWLLAVGFGSVVAGAVTLRVSARASRR